jgi:hypothetical protein
LPWIAEAMVEGGCDLNLGSLDDRSASCLYVQIVVDSGGTNPLGWYMGIPKLKACSSGTEYGGGTVAGDPSGDAYDELPTNSTAERGTSRYGDVWPDDSPGVGKKLRGEGANPGLRL